MPTASVVGKYINQTTGATCMVLKFESNERFQWREMYVTEDARYLELVSSEPLHFRNVQGDVFFPLDTSCNAD